MILAMRESETAFKILKLTYQLFVIFFSKGVIGHVGSWFI